MEGWVMALLTRIHGVSLSILMSHVQDEGGPLVG